MDNQESLKPQEEVKPRRQVGDGFIGKIKWQVWRFVLINCKATEKRNRQRIQKWLLAKNCSLNQITENALRQVKPFSRCSFEESGT